MNLGFRKYGIGLMFICLVYGFSCNEISTTEVVLGTGGGVAAALKEYKIYQTGKVELKDGLDGDFKEYGQLTKKETKMIYQNTEKIDLTNIDLNNPGNIYYFVEINRDEERKRVTWGAVNSTVPEEIKKLYDETMAIITATKH